jgi:arginase
MTRPASSDPSTRPITVIGVPFGHGAGQPGTELGPAASRIAGLLPGLAAIGRQAVDHGDIIPVPRQSAADQAPDLAGLGNHAALVNAWVLGTHDAVHAALEAGACPLVIGGDHSISMGSVSAAARHAGSLGKRLALFWIDAHADFNTPSTSPSKNLHGMSTALLTGHDELLALMAGRVFPPVVPRDICVIGARSIDRSEKAAVAKAGITCLDMRVIDEFGICSLMRDALARLDPATTHLHVSFDMDVVDPALAPGVGTPVAGGLTYREAHLLMEMLYESGLVASADFMELNPMLDHAGKTAHLLVDLAQSLFGKAISQGASVSAGSR